MSVQVVRIIDRLNAGGPAKNVVWLTSGLEAAGFQTKLITGRCAQGETDMSYLAQAAGVEPLVIPSMSREISLSDLLVVARLVRELMRLRPQIVHTHKSKAGTAGRIAAMLYKWLAPSALRWRPRQCHVVHTYHGHIFHSYYGRIRTGLFLTIERLLARLCTDRIIVVSERQRREICGRFHVGRPEQFRVVPLGLNMEELPRDTESCFRQDLGVGPDELLIGAIGRLTEIKNHIMLLQSARDLFPMLSESGIRAHLVIIGDGHLRATLEQQARELGIAGRLTFAGFRRDALALYPALDIVALTSLNEGTPLTLIEAMGCGRAVAAAEVGGVPDLLGSRQLEQQGFSVWDHGVSARSGDVAGFARALRFLAERPQLRQRMGARGRAFVETNFCRERLLSDVVELYRELSRDAGREMESKAHPVVSPNFQVEAEKTSSTHQLP